MSRRALALVLLAVLAVAVSGRAAAQLETREFVLAHRSASEAGRAIEPFLSPDGSLTVTPALRRLRVTDRPDVLRRIAVFLEQFDAAPAEYRLRISLFRARDRGRDGASPPGVERVDGALLARMRRLFRYERFDLLGRRTVGGTVGGEVSVGLGGPYGVTFTPRATLPLPALPELGDVPRPTPGAAGATPAPGARLRLPVKRPAARERRPVERLRLEHFRLLRRPAGGSAPEELLTTTLALAPGQNIVLGAAPSERSPEALVLVVEALELGEGGEE